MSEAKKYLMSVYKINRHIDCLLAEKERLKSIAEGVSAMRYDDIKVQSSHKENDSVIKLIELDKQINDEIDVFVDLRNEATALIEQLQSKVEQDVLKLRYICSMKWEDIADKMNYDVRSVYRIHGQALLSFDKVLKQNKF